MACDLAISLPIGMNGSHLATEHLNGTASVQYLEEGSPHRMTQAYNDTGLEKVRCCAQLLQTGVCPPKARRRETSSAADSVCLMSRRRHLLDVTW